MRRAWAADADGEAPRDEVEARWTCPCAAQGESTNPDLPYMRQLKFYFPDEALVRHHGAAKPKPARGAQ